MSIKIALAGNPNSGKTTLFNALTGSNQFVGNWPGVTVEKKEGKLKKHKDVIVTDLPGIYSLSPYTLEEVVARNYLIDEHPNVILNIVDGTNIERNLYLTTQLTEIGIPVVMAINMMDVVRKNGDTIDIGELGRKMGCEVCEISALKGDGINEAAELAIKAASNATLKSQHLFSGPVEHALAHIEEVTVHNLSEDEQRWYAVKLFERDQKAAEKLGIDRDVLDHIEADIIACEKELDDDAESIITNERYNYVTAVVEQCVVRKKAGKLTTSDKIDKVVTSRVLGLPIFACVMFLLYYISMVAVGAPATNWANDGLFGDGFHLFGIGTSDYNTASENYTNATQALDAFGALVVNEDGVVDAQKSLETAKSLAPEQNFATVDVFDEVIQKNNQITVYYDSIPSYADLDETNPMTLKEAIGYIEQNGLVEPDTTEYGVWVPGVPVLVENALGAMNVPQDGWVHGLVIDGIVSGVGSVLGFVPQLFVLFFLLAFIEACGYMSRIAFVLDRLFRKFGLSGKSFIPILLGTGCGVPGIMASRTIENINDRRMTIITTTFIPCGAKTPFIALIAGAIFGGSAWVATGAYFIGMASIIVSGIILKKTKRFRGEATPFVMELPAYHMPTLPNVLRSMWDRGWSFVKKATSVILISTILVWFTSNFGFVDGKFGMLSEEEVQYSLLAIVGGVIAPIFAPLGWGTWQASVASITGLVAKENIVGTLGVLYSGADVYANLSAAFTQVAGMSFLVFNLLCAPCFAAMGAIKREMNSAKWTMFAIGYQCGFAYLVAMCIYSFGNLFSGNLNNPLNIITFILSIVAIAYALFMLFRPYREESKK